jgi:hypothetical protein
MLENSDGAEPVRGFELLAYLERGIAEEAEENNDEKEEQADEDDDERSGITVAEPEGDADATFTSKFPAVQN